MNNWDKDTRTVEEKRSYEQADKRLTRLNQTIYYLEEQEHYDHRWTYLDGLTDMLRELLEESTDDRFLEESYFYRYPRLLVNQVFDMAIQDYYVEHKKDIEREREHYKNQTEEERLIFPFVDINKELKKRGIIK